MDEIEELAKEIFLKHNGIAAITAGMMAKFIIENGYSRHKPGKGLSKEKVAEEMWMEFRRRSGAQHEPWQKLPPNSEAYKHYMELADIVCAKFAAPSLPTIECSHDTTGTYCFVCNRELPKTPLNVVENIIYTIRNYWKFDNDQAHAHSWHDREECLKAVKALLTNPGVEKPGAPDIDDTNDYSCDGR